MEACRPSITTTDASSHWTSISMTAPLSVTNFNRAYAKGDQKKSKEDDSDSDTSSQSSKNSDTDAPHTVVELDLLQDVQMNMTPFLKTHALLHLTSLVNPKNVGKLTELGGTRGVIKALGTDTEKRLSNGGRCSALGTDVNIHDEGLVKSCPQQYDVEKGDFTENEQGKEKGTVAGGSGAGGDSGLPSSYFATIEDRQRVYGKNIVPSKKIKSLLLLMWVALQDKVLVSLKVMIAGYLYRY